MDIVGIVLIALPLLGKVYKNKEGWNLRIKIADLKAKLEGLNEELGTGEKASKKDLFDLWKYVYERLDQEMSYKEKQRTLACVGLIIVTIGFFLQIVGIGIQSTQPLQ